MKSSLYRILNSESISNCSRMWLISNLGGQLLIFDDDSGQVNRTLTNCFIRANIISMVSLDRNNSMQVEQIFKHRYQFLVHVPYDSGGTRLSEAPLGSRQLIQDRFFGADCRLTEFGIL